MEHLRERGMDSAIKEYASSGKPLLGICWECSYYLRVAQEFGDHRGLGLIEGEV